jgi:hypothetical protein
MRDRKSRSLVTDFFGWCQAEKDLVLDESPIAAAIGYAMNQQRALERFLEDGRLPMSNNISERHLRREAVGRVGRTYTLNQIFRALFARGSRVRARCARNATGSR